jgi:hypothetical protein
VINPHPRLRTWVLISAVGLAVVVLAGQRVAVNYIVRDRWEPFPVAGTIFQFTRVTVFVFNDTGHEVHLSVSAGGKLLFEQQLDAERPPERPPDSGAVHQIHAYEGKSPYAAVTVENYDTLTREIEITESLFLHRTEIVDLESIADRQGDLSIRVTKRGFEVKRAKYSFR